MYRIILVLLLTTNFAWGQRSYKVVVDETNSSVSGADNIVTFYKLLNGGERQFFPIKLSEEVTKREKLAGIGYRLGKFVLVDFPIEFFIHVVQHEVFGHGARHREIGFTRGTFRINFPPPYGNGGGVSARGQNNNMNRLVGGHENITTIMGGSEGSRLISDNLQVRWLAGGQIPYKESLLFLSTFHDFTAYIIGTKIFTSGITGGDVSTYIRRINNQYGFPEPADYPMDIDQLVKLALINLLNPLNAFSAYTYAGRYLLKGEERFKLPMINIKGVKYLPAVKMGLTPFGPEVYLENYFKKDGRLLNVYFRQGDNTFEQHYGFGLQGYNLLNNTNFSLDTSLEYWNQPSMELGGDAVYFSTAGGGGIVKAALDVKISKMLPIHLYTQLGYKTDGYISGERLAEGMIWRVGLSMQEFD